MLKDYSKVKPQVFGFKSRFCSGSYSLGYTFHANQPRTNRIYGLVIKESRIISAFTLERIDKLINPYIIKMCSKPGKWKFFIESAFGTIMFIVITKKKKNNIDGSFRFIAEFHSSYTLKSVRKIIRNKDKDDTIFLDDFLICEEAIIETPSEDEIALFLEKETKELAFYTKKKKKAEKKWNKKKKRQDNKYVKKLNYTNGRSKAYVPYTINAEQKEVREKRTAEKVKYDDYDLWGQYDYDLWGQYD